MADYGLFNDLVPGGSGAAPAVAAAEPQDFGLFNELVPKPRGNIAEASRAVARGSVGMAGNVARGFSELMPESAPDLGIGRLGRSVTGYAQERFAPTPGRENEFAVNAVPEAVGGMAVGAAPVVAGSLLGTPATGFGIGAGLFGLGGAGQAGAEAEALGATPGQRQAAAAAGGLANAALAFVPGGQLTRGAARVLPSLAERGIVGGLGRTGAAAAEGAAIGGAGQIVNNEVARQTYDPSRDLTEGAGHAAAVTGVAAGILHPLIGRGAEPRRPPPEPEPGAPPGQLALPPPAIPMGDGAPRAAEPLALVPPRWMQRGTAEAGEPGGIEHNGPTAMGPNGEFVMSAPGPTDFRQRTAYGFSGEQTTYGADLSRYATGNAVPGGPSSVEGIHPEFGSRIERMVADMPPEIAAKFSIISGFRSPERQAQVNPGVTNSRHSHGMAVDLTTDPDVLGWINQNGAKYGVGFPLADNPREVNHLEPIENGTRIPGHQVAAWSEGNGGTARGGSSIDAALDLIAHHESKGDPLIGWGRTDLSGYKLTDTGFPDWPGKPGPKGNSTAAGLWQITRETWDPIARRLGITDFSPESQRAVATELYRTRGFQPWAPYNPELAAAIERGDHLRGGGTREAGGGMLALPAPEHRLALPKPETTYGADFLMSDTKRPAEEPKPVTAQSSPLDRALNAVSQLNPGDPVTRRLLARLSGLRSADQIATLRDRMVKQGVVSSRDGRYYRAETANKPEVFSRPIPTPAETQQQIAALSGQQPSVPAAPPAPIPGPTVEARTPGSPSDRIAGPTPVEMREMNKRFSEGNVEEGGAWHPTSLAWPHEIQQRTLNAAEAAGLPEGWKAEPKTFKPSFHPKQDADPLWVSETGDTRDFTGRLSHSGRYVDILNPEGASVGRMSAPEDVSRPWFRDIVEGRLTKGVFERAVEAMQEAKGAPVSLSEVPKELMGPGDRFPTANDAAEAQRQAELKELPLAPAEPPGEVPPEAAHHQRLAAEAAQPAAPVGDRAALRDELYSLVRERAPTLRLRTLDELVGTIEGRTSPIHGAYHTETRPGGLLEHIASVAMPGPDPRGALTHEIVHFFRRAGMFTRAEWEILSGKADKWAEHFKIHERYKDKPLNVRREEAVAEAYAAWDRGDMQMPPGLRRIFGKVKDFFERTGHWLRGRGFQNADDVFRAMDRGEVGGRPFGETIGGARYERADLTGAPLGVRSPAILGALRSKLLGLAHEGEPGRFWYENSGRAIGDVAGGDLERASKVAQAFGVTSPQMPVPQNTEHGVKGYNQAMTGRPTRAGMFPGAMGDKLSDIFYRGQDWAGRKTNAFYGNMMHFLDPSIPQSVTNDIWMMRAFEYPTKGGDQYQGTPTKRQYDFVERETRRIVDRLNQNATIPWDPKQVQAAIWTAIKARTEGKSTEDAAFDFSHGLARSMAQQSYESIPGRTTHNLPEMFRAEPELTRDFHRDVVDAITDAGGRDIINQHFGLLTGRTIEAPGAFEGGVHPGSQARSAVSPEGPNLGLEPASRDLLNAAEYTRGLLLGQDAAAWHRPFFKTSIKAGDRNFAEFQMGRPLSEAEARDLYAAMTRNTGSDFFAPIGSGEGARFINIPDVTGMDNRTFQRHVVSSVKEVFGSDNVSGSGTLKMGAADSNYLPIDWKGIFNGEDPYREFPGGRPDLQKRSAELLAALGPRIAEIQDRYAGQHGWSVNPGVRIWERGSTEGLGGRVPEGPRPWTRGEVPPESPYQRPAAADDRVEAALRQIRTTPDERPLQERSLGFIKGALNRIRDEARYATVDSFDPIAKLEKGANKGELRDAAVSAFKAAHLSRELPAMMSQVVGLPDGKGGFIGGVPMLKDGAYVTNPDSKPLSAVLKPIFDAGLQKPFELWMAVTRGKRLMAEGRENLISPEMIAEFKDLDQKHLGPNGENIFRDTQKEWIAFNKRLLDFAEQTGLVNKEQRGLWERGDYVPFFRNMGEEVPTGPGRGAGGIANQNSGIKALKGGAEKLNSLYENMFTLSESLVSRSVKNEAARRTRDLAEPLAAMEKVSLSEKMAETGKRRGDNIVSLMDGGKQQYYRVTQPLLLKAISNFGPLQAEGITKWLGLPKKLLTMAVTREPTFMAANLMRDTLHSWVVTGSDFKPGFDTMKGAIAAVRHSPEAMALMAGGGGGHHFYESGAKGAKGFIRELDGGWSPLDPRRLWDKLGELGSASEMANRIAIYEAALKRGDSNAEAIWQAKDLLNFTASGGSQLMKFLVQTVPFMNARVQGLDRLQRGARENPASFLMRGGLITAASLGLWAMNKDNPDYQRLPDYEKQAYWHLFLPGFSLRIPKPFEVGAIFGAVPEMLGDFADNGNWNQLWRAFVANGTQQLNLSPIPQAFSPALDVATNTNSLTKGPIVNEAERHLIPGERFGPNTSTTMKALGQQLGISPDQMEYLFKGYSGTLGGYLLSATDQLTDAATGRVRPETRLDQYPIVSRFIRTEPTMANRWINGFYDIKTEADQLHATMGEMVKQGRAAEAQELVKDNLDMLGLRGSTQSIGAQLTAVRKAMKQIQDTPNLSGAEMRQRLDQLTVIRNRLGESARQIVERARP